MTVRLKSLALVILLAACTGGCVHRQLIALDDYQPIMRGVGDPDVAVALLVEDGRTLPAGDDAADIGVMHESFGETTEFELSDPAAIRYLVRAATKNALRLARINVSPQAPRTLVVTIRKFWVAVPSREAHIIVGLVLQDRQGATLWSGSAVGGAGGWIWADFPQSMLRGVYQRSLANYAETASRAFASAEFQRQIY